MHINTSHSLRKYNQSFSSLTSTTCLPNSHPAPLGEMFHALHPPKPEPPVSNSSGSLQTRSQKAPLWGISWLRSIVLIWSKVLISGERPPCTQRIWPSINAATVIRSNTYEQQLTYHISNTNISGTHIPTA